MREAQDVEELEILALRLGAAVDRFGRIAVVDLKVDAGVSALAEPVNEGAYAALGKQERGLEVVGADFD